MAEVDNWTRKWAKCWRCKQMTPHKPYLQNWGPAWTECIICGDRNLFTEYRNIQNTERRYLHTKGATTRKCQNIENF